MNLLKRLLKRKLDPAPVNSDEKYRAVLGKHTVKYLVSEMAIPWFDLGNGRN